MMSCNMIKGSLIGSESLLVRQLVVRFSQHLTVVSSSAWVDVITM